MSWHGIVGLSLTSRVCLATDSANRTLHTAHCAWRNAQSADHAVTRVCPIQPGSLTACNRYRRILSALLSALLTPVSWAVLPWGSNAQILCYKCLLWNKKHHLHVFQTGSPTAQNLCTVQFSLTKITQWRNMLNGTPHCYHKSHYELIWRKIIWDVCIASKTPRLAIDCHAVFPFVFLQYTCQSNQVNVNYARMLK